VALIKGIKWYSICLASARPWVQTQFHKNILAVEILINRLYQIENRKSELEDKVDKVEHSNNNKEKYKQNI
jgi:hypothetical protein